jgi:hypothetical protein
LEGFEIKVPITIKGGKEGERAGKQIGEKIAEQIKKSFKSIGLFKETGGGGEASAIAGLSKSMKGTTAKLGVIAAIAAVTLGVLRQASPYLKGVLSIFGRAFMIFFRPFGDFLATLLRPLAIWLMKMAVAFLKWTRGSSAGKAGVAAGTGAGAGALVGGAIGSVVPGIGTAIGAGVGAGIGALVGLLTQLDWGAIGDSISLFIKGLKETLVYFIKDPVGFLIDLGGDLKVSMGIFKDRISDAWNTFINWLGTALPNFAGWLGEQMGKGLRMIVDFILAFGPWLWNALTTTFFKTLEILTAIGKWIWDTIIAFMKDPLGTLSGMGKWIWDTITGTLSNIWDSLSGIGSWIWNMITSSLSNFIGGVGKGYRGYATGTPFVPETGLYQLHRGEQVIPRGQASNRSLIFKPTFEITGSGVSQNIDMDAIVRRAGRITEMELKKRNII